MQSQKLSVPLTTPVPENYVLITNYKKISIYYVSERLGHKDIETTHKHYAHVTKELRAEEAKDTVAIFSNMLSG